MELHLRYKFKLDAEWDRAEIISPQKWQIIF